MAYFAPGEPLREVCGGVALFVCVRIGRVCSLLVACATVPMHGIHHVRGRHLSTRFFHLCRIHMVGGGLSPSREPVCPHACHVLFTVLAPLWTRGSMPLLVR